MASIYDLQIQRDEKERELRRVREEVLELKGLLVRKDALDYTLTVEISELTKQIQTPEEPASIVIAPLSEEPKEGTPAPPLTPDDEDWPF